MQGAVRLSDWGVIRAQGPDAASFLHGQLTQDVQHLESGRACLAGYCNAKGRLLASFVVWRAGPDELMLACSADLLSAALKRLSMFVLRAKCKLSDASASVNLFGVAGPATLHGFDFSVPTLPWHCTQAGAEVMLLLPDAAGRVRMLLARPADAPPPALPALPSQAWSWLEASSGVTRIVAATVEQFVPQMVNFELVGGVNFQKGCFPGQEVVARSQYRGTVKRRAFVFDSEAAAMPGQEVFHSDDREQPAGMVVNAGSWDGSHRAWIELKLAALATGSLSLGAGDGPQVRLAVPQPYAVLVDGDA